MNKSFVNTGEICVLYIIDENIEDGLRMIDMGDYWKDENGNKILKTYEHLAKEYGHLVDVPMYVKGWIKWMA